MPTENLFSQRQVTDWIGAMIWWLYLAILLFANNSNN
jgi:hypothetical protein